MRRKAKPTCWCRKDQKTATLIRRLCFASFSTAQLFTSGSDFEKDFGREGGQVCRYFCITRKGVFYDIVFIIWLVSRPVPTPAAVVDILACADVYIHDELITQFLSHFWNSHLQPQWKIWLASLKWLILHPSPSVVLWMPRNDGSWYVLLILFWDLKTVKRVRNLPCYLPKIEPHSPPAMWSKIVYFAGQMKTVEVQVHSGWESCGGQSHYLHHILFSSFCSS